MDVDAKGLRIGGVRRRGSEPDNPQHVANVVRDLASERAAWLSGQVFEITGTSVRRGCRGRRRRSRPSPWTPEALDAAMATRSTGRCPGRVIPVALIVTDLGAIADRLQIVEVCTRCTGAMTTSWDG